MQNHQKELLKVVKELFRTLGIRYTPGFLASCIRQYGNQSGLQGIKDILDRYLVNHLVVKVPSSELEDFDGFIFCNLLEKETQTLLIIHEVNKHGILAKDSSGRIRNMTREHFEASWDNIALLVDRETQGAEPNYKIRQQKAKSNFSNRIILALGLTAFLFTLIWSLSYISDMSEVFIIVAKLFGVTATVFIMTNSMGQSGAFFQRVCHKTSFTDCEAVTSSRAGKFLGIPVMYFGFFYFLFTVLVLIYRPDRGDITIIKSLNFIAITYSIFAVYYQIVVIKKLCPLCIMVQVVIGIEFLLLFPVTLDFGQIFHSSDDLILFLALSILITLGLKFYFETTKELEAKDDYIYSLRNNLSLLNRATNGRTVEQFELDGTIFSCNNPDNEITILMNPTCTPCRLSHSILHELIEANVIQANISIFPLPESDDEGSLSYQASKHIVAYFQENQDYGARQNLISSWFKVDNMDFEKLKIWKQNFPVTDSHAGQEELEKVVMWMYKNELYHTPCFVVNNRVAEDFLEIEDINFFLKKVS